MIWPLVLVPPTTEVVKVFPRCIFPNPRAMGLIQTRSPMYFLWTADFRTSNPELMIPGMIRRGRRLSSFVFFVDNLGLWVLFVVLFLPSLDPTDDDIEDRKALIVLRTNKDPRREWIQSGLRSLEHDWARIVILPLLRWYGIDVHGFGLCCIIHDRIPEGYSEDDGCMSL